VYLKLRELLSQRGKKGLDRFEQVRWPHSHVQTTLAANILIASRFLART